MRKNNMVKKKRIKMKRVKRVVRVVKIVKMNKSRMRTWTRVTSSSPL